MRQSDPPRAAMWMLRRLVPGERNDALAGDLLEEFRSGRSAAWYWRQVLACVAIRNTRVVLAHSGVLLFAVLWALLAPVWFPLSRLGAFPHLDQAIVNLAWPWSTICGLGLSFFILIFFVWAGLLIYLTLETLAGRHFSAQRLRNGIMRSAAVFVPLYVSFRSLTLILPGFGMRLSRKAAHHPLGPFILAESICVPFFLTLLWAMWDASRIKCPRGQQSQDGPGERS
ncbi:MAG TPA: hypothetical protein VGS10_00440 [Terracidiphilus sp.]|nr:hypothetical protein [Terracidiphilus sp.]